MVKNGAPPKPDFCPFIYHDGDSIYLEFETIVLRFAYTEGGLHKALAHIPNVAKQPGFLSGGRNIPERESIVGRIARKTQPRIKREPKREAKGFSEDVKTEASSILKKLGMK